MPNLSHDATKPYLEILQAGVQSTIQDLGRKGTRHLGIAQAGALDAPSLRLANYLVGNEENAAGIEVVIGPVDIRFPQSTWFAICGADFTATLDGKAIAPGWRYHAQAGAVLRLRGPQRECRAYLAIAGGIIVENVLGAKATDLQAEFGGFQGRALRKQDVLEIGHGLEFTKSIGVQQRKWTPEIRAVVGPEFEQFSKKAQQDFWEHAWKVSNQSNRMGYRLQGNRLDRCNKQDLFSHAVMPGVVQVPPNGQPIVLLADAQTTGGYPRIACVIQADLWKLAQTPIGKSFCFIRTDLETARRAAQQAHKDLETIRQHLNLYA